MKPNLLTPNTLLLGIWTEAGRTAITGAVRTVDAWKTTKADDVTVYEQVQVAPSTVVAGVIEVTGTQWQALADALEQGRTVGARHLVMLANDSDLVKALSKPVQVPDGEEHWQVIRALAMWAGAWAIKHEVNLPGAKELWQLKN